MTDEEIEKLYKHNMEECDACMKKLEVKRALELDGIKGQIRKDTAREIYNAVSPLLIMKNKKYGNDPMTIAANEWFEKKVKEIFEPFGVEVKL
ncbi:MAG: hypothetical protein OSJ39_02160 [Clostridia bacterium]|nr:hypothetical protein [Clostridia bacterium]